MEQIAISEQQLVVSSAQNDLVDCPFCGWKTQVMRGSNGLTFYVSCTREKCFDGPFRSTEGEAVNEYNRIAGAVAQLETVFKVKRDEHLLESAVMPLEKALQVVIDKKGAIVPLKVDIAEDLIHAVRAVVKLHRAQGEFNADAGGELLAYVHEVVSNRDKASVGNAQRGAA